MEGRARAPAAGTVLNALATGTGSAFAIELDTYATVELTPGEDVEGTIREDDTADTRLIERCVELTIARFAETDEDLGGTVETTSDVPIAAGLKSSSAAANATVLATLDALGQIDDVEREEACRLGVQAARDAGVTVTGAFDDASASMLGGVTVTENTSDRLLSHESFDKAVAVYIPEERAYSADADVERCTRIGVVADVVAEMARAGDYERAMTINGFAYTAALGFSAEPMLLALEAVDGVSLSGTGPSTVAVGDPDAVEMAADRWSRLPGTILQTETDMQGARVT